MYGKRAPLPVEPEAWLAVLDDVRRPQLMALDARIRALAPDLPRYVDHGFLSYGRYTYRYASGREGEWMCLALASNKQYISMYVSPTPLEPFAARLPKADLGKGCVRFKRLEDLDEAVLDEVIRAAASNHGSRVTSS